MDCVNRIYKCGDRICLSRSRVNALLENAIKKPLTIVCAGAGYGKTFAVSDFIAQKDETPIIVWVQLSQNDNIGSYFWENFTNAIAKISPEDADKLRTFGFPNTEDKLAQLVQDAETQRHIEIRNNTLMVFDNIHLINSPDVIRFFDNFIHGIYDATDKVATIMLCREFPKFNFAGLQLRDIVSVVNENELNFTKSELSQYFCSQGLSLTSQVLSEIFEDTEGWAFSLSFIARLLKKSPGYSGYVRDIMKQNIFKLLEIEVFNVVSQQAQRFLVRLSLVGHLSIDLVKLLAFGDDSLLAELQLQNAYIHFDSYTNAYLINHLFIDFLHTKKELLTDEEISQTYKTVADWCRRNNFKIDALNYYEKAVDYESIVSVTLDFPPMLPQDIALCIVEIAKRAPVKVFDQINLFATVHVRAFIALGHFQKALELSKHYEQRMLRLPADCSLRNCTLGVLYYIWGNIRIMMSTTDGCYDFDKMFMEMDKYLAKSTIKLPQMASTSLGSYVIPVGVSKKNALKEFIEVVARSIKYISRCWDGALIGADDLLRAELLFYQGDVSKAEAFIAQALERACEHKQHAIAHRALFYLLRIAVFRGNYEKAEQVLKDMEARLKEKDYLLRFTTYDIILGWYYWALRQPKMIPHSLKEKFAPYAHAYYIENFANQIKARYYYLTKNYQPLLTYIKEMKQRESILYGRIEMTIIEACIFYKMKDTATALKALQDAYEVAAPNDIIMPFIELGKDMRTLASAALREPECSIPQSWLQNVKSKSASYAKFQSVLISDYKKANGINDDILSARESEILLELYHGLPRSEIANKKAVSISAINFTVNNIFNKLGACNVADAVRIATEWDLV